MQTTMNSPELFTFYRGISAALQKRIPHFYNALEICAAATEIAQRMAGEVAPDRGHFKQAIQFYMRDLPNDLESANRIIKQDASKVLGIPGLASDYDKLQAARDALAAAEAEVAAREAEQGARLSRIHHLDGIIAEASGNLAGWNLDFDQIEANSRSTIAALFGRIGVGAIYDGRTIDVAFEDIARVRILRELAPAAVAKLQATIATAQAELDTLREPAESHAPPLESEPSSLAADEPEEGLKPIVSSRDRKVLAA